MTPGLKKLHEIMKLAMDVTTDGDWTVDRLNVGLLNQNFFHLQATETRRKSIEPSPWKLQKEKP